MRSLLLSVFFMTATGIFAINQIAISKARVVSQISVSNTNGQILEFGKIAMGSSNSVVRIAPVAVVSPEVLSGGDAFVLGMVTQTAAKFTVTGDAGLSYSVTLPISINVNNGLNTLTVNNFKSSVESGGVIGTVDVFYVGADLIIPSNAVIGSYSGPFPVVVSYN